MPDHRNSSQRNSSHDFFPRITLQSVLWTMLTIVLWTSLLSFSQKDPSSNLLGLVGYALAFTLHWVFGLGAYILLALVTSIAIFELFADGATLERKKLIAGIAFLGSCSLLLSVTAHIFPTTEAAFGWFLGSKTMPLGGHPCTYVYRHFPYIPLERLFNTTGTGFLAFSGLILSSFALCDFNIKRFFKEKDKDTPQKEKSESRSSQPPTTFTGKVEEKQIIDKNTALPEKPFSEKPEPRKSKSTTSEIAPIISVASSDLKSKKSVIKKGEPSEGGENNTELFNLPSFDLLVDPKKCDVGQLKEELREKATQLESTLLNFGIEAKVGQIHCGPTITSFEVHPAIGVKVGKIKTLEHDIALNMEAKSIRIIAPIPGKAAVGIEIPNSKPQEVSFKEVLSSYLQQGGNFKIPMVLGKAVSGELVVCDLTKLPHCIIAGATGSGKSVCINSIVMSILMLMRPDEVRLLMIDPKKVELTPYSKLPHMIAPVITEPEAAANALGWLVKEMEKRYEILKITGVRNIESFNKRTPSSDEQNSIIQIPAKLPYYVAIIDELADLMMVSSQDIETPIARIAQMARAVGIHLILATQRPSREVITGLIKANFPARIAFKVASRVNSQIILDDTGAETLLGYGDMLFLLPGSSQLIRAQGVYVRDEEINGVIESILRQSGPQYLIESFEKIRLIDSSRDTEAELDSLFEEAKNIVFSTGNASTTFLQRKLKIGYARAASIMDQLEDQGIIGPQDGSKPRAIYFPSKGRPNNEDDDPFNDDLDHEDTEL